MADWKLFDNGEFDAVAFNALYSELIFHYPMMGNWQAIIRADMTDAIAWAKTKTGYAGAVPDFITHLECATLSEDTKTPAIALHPVLVTPEISLDMARVTTMLDFNALILIRGDEPNDLSIILDTYVLALAALWLQAPSATLFDGYHASAMTVGGNRREISFIALGEEDAPRIIKGKYLRTAQVGFQTSFECG